MTDERAVVDIPTISALKIAEYLNQDAFKRNMPGLGFCMTSKDVVRLRCWNCILRMGTGFHSRDAI